MSISGGGTFNFRCCLSKKISIAAASCCDAGHIHDKFPELLRTQRFQGDTFVGVPDSGRNTGTCRSTAQKMLS
jgi:hypothetical protein